MSARRFRLLGVASAGSAQWGAASSRAFTALQVLQAVASRSKGSVCEADGLGASNRCGDTASVCLAFDEAMAENQSTRRQGDRLQLVEGYVSPALQQPLRPVPRASC